MSRRVDVLAQGVKGQGATLSSPPRAGGATDGPVGTGRGRGGRETSWSVGHGASPTGRPKEPVVTDRGREGRALAGRFTDSRLSW